MVEDTGSDSDSAPSSSRSTFRSDILRSIVAHQCLKIGWHSVTDSSLTALTNVLDSYLKRFSQNIAGYAGVAGRTVPTVKDFQVALRDVEPSVQLKDLSSFCANLKDSALEFEINLPVVAGKEPVESASREGPASPGIVNGSEPSGSSQAPIPLVNGVHDERPEWMDDDLVFPPVNNRGHVRPVEKERPKENEVKTRPVLSDIIIAEDDEDIFPQSSFAAQKALPCRPEASATAGPRLLKSVSLVNGQFLFPEATVLPSARPPLPPPPVVKPSKPVEMPPKQKRKTSISETADASTPVGLPPHKKQKIKFIMTEPLPVTSDSVHPPGDELKIRIPHPKPEKEKKLKKDRKAPSAERMPVELPIPPAPRNDFAPVRLPSPPPLDSHERPHKSVMLKFKKPVPLLVNKKDQNSDERGPEFVEIRNHEHARRPEKHKKPRRELELYPVASQQQSSVMEKPKKKLDQAIDRIKQQQRDGVLPEELHRNHNHHLPQYDRIPKPYHNDVGMYPAVEQPRKTKKEHKHEEDRERKRAEREKERMRMIQEENIRRLEAEEFAKRQEAEEFANNEELRMQRAREARQREEQARRIRAEELLKREQQFHQEVIVPPVEPKKVKHRDGKKPSETHRFLQQEYMMQPTPPKAIQKGSDRPLSRDQDGPQSRPGSSSSRPGSAPEKPRKQQLPPNNQPPLKVTFKMPAKETVAKASLPPPPPERAPPLSITSPQPYQTAEPRFDLMAGVPHASPSNQKLSFTPPVYPPAPATTAPLDLSMKSPARPPVAPVAPVPSVVSPASRPLSGHKLARPTAPSETKPSKLPKPQSAQIPVDVVPLDEAPVMSKKKTPETAPVYVPPVLPPSAPPTPVPRPSTPQSDPLQPGLMGEGDKLWICPSCGRPDDGSPMVGCDECDDWFHWPCVGLMTEPTVEKWFCPRCTDRKLSKSKKGKKR